jgi:hypothetical protein
MVLPKEGGFFNAVIQSRDGGAILQTSKTVQRMQFRRHLP